jgi:hypothetical protein
MWAAVGGAVIGAAGSAYSANQNKKAAAKAANQPSAGGAAQAANQQSWSDIDRMSELNKANALWTQQQNQNAMDSGMVDSSNQWGSVSRERDPVTGQLKQTSALAGPWSDIANAGAAQYGTMQGALGSGFNVNSDYMNALRAQLQPGYDQMAAAQRNRAAAMGTGFNSGAANAGMEDQLGRNFNDMNQKAVLGGYDAWLKDQANSRSNMGQIMSGQQGMQALSQQPAWSQQNGAQMSQINYDVPKNATYEAAQQDFNRSQLAAANQASTGTGWGNAIMGIGGALGNKDLQQGVKDWWTSANAPNGGGTPGEWSPTGPGYGPQLPGPNDPYYGPQQNPTW